MGSYQTLLADRAIFAFQRDSVGESVVVIINSDTRSTTVDIAPALSPAGTPVAEGTRYQNLLDGAQHLQVQGGHLKAITIPARGAVLLYATMDAH
jgi:hypothetical protein